MQIKNVKVFFLVSVPAGQFLYQHSHYFFTLIELESRGTFINSWRQKEGKTDYFLLFKNVLLAHEEVYKK